MYWCHVAAKNRVKFTVMKKIKFRKLFLNTHSFMLQEKKVNLEIAW